MVVYAPHVLQVKRTREIRDRYNRTVEIRTEWEDLCPCRCDDNTTTRINDAAGNAFVPAYHIVASRCEVRAGDIVRAMDGECVRGEGEVKRVIRTNYLDYCSIYV